MLKRIILSIFIFAVWLGAFAQVDAEQVINIGRNVLSMDDYMLSIQYFNKAINAKPYLSEPYYLRAFAKMSLDDYEGAEADCTLAIERNKFKTETYKLRGFARQNLGKDSLAIEDYKIGLNYNPQDKYFLFYKSVAETSLQRYETADSTFSILLRLYPRFDDGYTARGRMFMLRGDTIAALADISKAIDLSGTSIQPYLLRADIEAKQKNWELALSDMNQAIIFKPHEPDFYLNRAFIRYNLDDYFGAMSDYNYTLELEPYNSSALFNRALLRYEVKDLERAAADFEEVLRLDPDNLHARYNLGLVNLERGRYKTAASDFDAIARRYPRFYPAYYGRAEALNKSGNLKGAIQSMNQAENLIRAYVSNPDRNPLDRPAIQSGTANTGANDISTETEEDVMDRYNQLVTAGDASETRLAYNDRIKGRVQDNNINVDLQPAYMVSIIAPSGEALNNTTGYLRDLDNFNRNQYIGQTLYLAQTSDLTHEQYGELFLLADQLEETAMTSERAADWLALGVARTQLKDTEAAIRALDRAIELLPDFATAFVERAYARQISSDAKQLALALRDYDEAFRLNPYAAFVWLNKGNIYYTTGDFTSALNCYTKALETDPKFGPALFNRGITYLRMGNKNQAFADLSKAGELGVLPSYNLLKRMK